MMMHGSANTNPDLKARTPQTNLSLLDNDDACLGDDDGRRDVGERRWE